MKEITYRRMSEDLAPRLAGRSRQVEALLYVAVAVVSWWARTVQDDAFISFRYARNLAEGHGLVYNPGEKVEGYTNFLWTVILWIPEHFGWNTPVFSILVTVPLAVGTVALGLRLARKVFVDNEPLALLAAFALAANMTFIGYASSGLETMLQTFLVTTVGLLLVPTGDDPQHPAPGVAVRLAAGLFGALAILTRIDSVVVVGAWFVVHLWWMLRRRGDAPGAVVAAAVQLAVAPLALLVPWLIWKQGYYGELLPNTLAAKSWPNSWVPFLFGLFYLLIFFASYAAFLLIGRYRRLKGTFPAPQTRWALATVVGLWFLYICVVGADFMEFRFVVPVIPILALPAAWLIDHYRTAARQGALIGVLLVVSLLHRLAPPLIPYPVLTFNELKHWPTDDPNDWETMGTMLKAKFPGGIGAEGQPVLGIIPAGAVPYYSELPAIDMLGLNDRWTAKNGLVYPIYFPGHVRVSTIAYLERRQVSLVLGSIREVQYDPKRTSYRLSELLDIVPAGDLRNLPDDAEVVEIPFRAERAWRVIYLRHDHKVDEVIESSGWRTYPIERTCDDRDIDALARIFAERTCPDSK